MGLPLGQKLVKWGSTWVRLCGTHISETTGWIDTISSSMELSWPVVVQHHGHLTLTLDFQGQILKMLYLRIGRAGWHGTIKGCESIGCYTHFVTVNVPLTHDLDLGFSRSNFEKVVSQEWDGRLTWTKGMWVYRMLHLLCDFQCPPHPWLWPWIFKVKFWKCCIPGMEGPIDMEQKRCESIRCYTHFVTVNIPLTHDLDLGFSRSKFEKVVSQEWDGRLTWNERDVSR